MKILVTGGTGFLGGHLCEYFKKLGYEVTALIRNPNKAAFLNQINIPYVIADITNKNKLIDAMKGGFDAVIHSAGFVSDRGDIKIFREINVKGTKNIAEAMVEMKILRLIHISTIAIYGEPGINITEESMKKKIKWFKYGLTKLEAEEVLEKYNELKITYLRPGHILGRRDRFGFVPILYHTMRKNNPLINNGDSITSLVYVDDVCKAVDLSLKNEEKSTGEAYNLVIQEQISIREIVDILHNKLGIPIPQKSKSFKYAFIMASFFEFFSKIFKFKIPLTRMTVVLAGKNFHASSDKITKQLGWNSSKSYIEMIQEWVEWRKEFEENRKSR